MGSIPSNEHPMHTKGIQNEIMFILYYSIDVYQCYNETTIAAGSKAQNSVYKWMVNKS